MSAFRGFIGEIIVHLSLKLGLNKKDYHVFRNVIVPYPGGTSQIDNLVVSKYGIFVIEVKNYQGWIFGGEKQNTWTQVIYRKKFKFQNPLIQNRGHIRALKQCLILSDDQFQSVVYFAGNGRIKTKVPSNVLTRGLIPHLRSYTSEIVSEKEVTNCVALIEGFREFKELNAKNHRLNRQIKSNNHPI